MTDPFKQYGIGDAVAYRAVTGVNVMGRVVDFVDGNPKVEFRNGSVAVCEASRVSLDSIDINSMESREAFFDWLAHRVA